MAGISKLDKTLTEAFETFNKEINFNLETFEQNRTGEYLTKNDMEEIARQTYYVLNSFKNAIVKYLQENSK